MKGIKIAVCARFIITNVAIKQFFPAGYTTTNTQRHKNVIKTAASWNFLIIQRWNKFLDSPLCERCFGALDLSFSPERKNSFEEFKYLNASAKSTAYKLFNDISLFLCQDYSREIIGFEKLKNMNGDLFQAQERKRGKSYRIFRFKMRSPIFSFN